jgi:hypothetical protein
MPRDLSSRAGQLSEAVFSQPAPRRVRLVRVMAAVRVQRAAACLIPALCLAALIFAIAAIRGTVEYRRGPWASASEPLRAVGDARWDGDYRTSDAVAALPLDDRSTVVATAGGSVQHLRADGGPLGLWQTFDAESTGGALLDPNLVAAHDAGPRLYFVGSGGSLTSASRDLTDWRLHLGGHGFARDVDLGTALTALAVDRDADFFVVGTKQNGAALYDVQTRQWVLPGSEEPPQPTVTSIVLHDHSVWIGTTHGLRVYTWSRDGHKIRVSRDAGRELPSWYSREPIHALDLVRMGNGASIDCVIGEGAHLTRPAQGGAWVELVGEGVDEYKNLSGPVVVSSLLDLDGEIMLGLPGFGVARYRPGRRSLVPWNVDLWSPESGEPPANGWPEIVPGPGFPSKRDEVWLIAHPARNTAGILYRWHGSTWERAASDVSALAFANSEPIVKRANGSVAVGIGANDAAVPSLFLPFPDASAPLGAADVSDTSLIVAQRRRVWLYSTLVRGWSLLPEADSDVEQVRVGRAGIGVIEVDGKAAVLAASGGAVSRVFGPSSLPRQAGDVQSAAMFNQELWFVRNGAAHMYSPQTATIGGRQRGLKHDFAARRLRATGSTLYAIGDLQYGLTIAYRSARSDDWNHVDGLADDSYGDSTVLSTRDALVVLHTNRSLLVRSDAHGTTELLQSQAPARWRQLEAARFGWLLGLTMDGTVLSYTDRTASWAPVGNDRFFDSSRKRYSTFLVTSDGDRDRMFLGSDTGIEAFAIGPGAIEQDPKPILTDENVVALDVADGNLWALTRTRGSSSSIKVRVKGGDWRSVWTTSLRDAPSAADWRAGVWADFVGHELRWLTAGGTLFQYDLQERSWKRNDLGSARVSRVRAPDDKQLWWIDHGRLRARSSAVTSQLWLERLSFSLDSLRERERSLMRWRDLLLRVAAVTRIVPWAVIELRIAYGLASVRRVIATLGPFERASFAGTVLDYSIEPTRLLVATSKGVWTFQRNGFELQPDHFQPHLAHHHWPIPSPCPATDPSSQWRIVCRGARLAVERREATDAWREVRVVQQGLEEDQLTDLDVSKDQILATTPTGMLSLREGGSGATYDHFDPFPDPGVGVVRKLEGKVFWFDSRRMATIHDSTAENHWRVVSSWPNADSRYGVRWSHGPAADVLDARDFDPSLGKFRRDIVKRLVKDVNDVPWIETAMGWRNVQFGPGGATLGQVMARAPEPDRRPIVADVNPRWQVRVEGSHNADKVVFTFRPTGRTYRDPFGDRGRLPDEDARSVAVGDDQVWFGTLAGLRVSASDEVGLAGHRVLDVRYAGGTLYARTDAGDLQRSGTTWIATGSSSFPTLRELRLPLGPDLEVKARENRVKGGFRTELDDFDRNDQRFVQDRIVSLAGTDDGLWMLSPTGAQHLVLRNGAIASQSAVMPGTAFAALRRDRQGRICAIDSFGDGWILSGSPHAVSAADRANPCGLLGSAISALVFWKRELSAVGDSWTLESRLGPLSFIKGKLSTDVVLDLVRATQPAWEVTAAGVLHPGQGLEKTHLIAPHRRSAKLALDGSRLVSRDIDGTFAYDAATGTWISSQTAALDSPRMRFDGMTWNFETVGTLDPVLASMSNQNEELVLNGQGQFSFDHATAIASRDGEAWILTGGGVTVYASADHRPLRALARPSLPPTCKPRLRGDEAGRVWLSCPAGVFVSDGESFRPATGPERDTWSSQPELLWSGRLADGNITASVDRHTTAAEIRISAGEGRRASVRAPPDVIGLAGAGTVLWVLTPRQLYALDLSQIR